MSKENKFWLPNEVWDPILRDMKEDEIVNLYHVNKFFRGIVNNYLEREFGLGQKSLSHFWKLAKLDPKLELDNAPRFFRFQNNFRWVCPQGTSEGRRGTWNRQTLFEEVKELEFLSFFPDHYAPFYKWISQIEKDSVIEVKGSFYEGYVLGPFHLVVRDPQGKIIIQAQGERDIALDEDIFVFSKPFLIKSPEHEFEINFNKENKPIGSLYHLEKDELNEMNELKIISFTNYGFPVSSEKFFVSNINSLPLTEEQEESLNPYGSIYTRYDGPETIAHDYPGFEEEDEVFIYERQYDEEVEQYYSLLYGVFGERPNLRSKEYDDEGGFVMTKYFFMDDQKYMLVSQYEPGYGSPSSYTSVNFVNESFQLVETNKLSNQISNQISIHTYPFEWNIKVPELEPWFEGGDFRVFDRTETKWLILESGIEISLEFDPMDFGVPKLKTIRVTDGKGSLLFSQTGP